MPAARCGVATAQIRTAATCRQPRQVFVFNDASQAIDVRLYVGDPCGNCPTTYNPSQQDTNGDGIGDACQVIPPCLRCVSNTDCRDVLEGTPCGKGSCNGTCKVCGGKLDCFPN